MDKVIIDFENETVTLQLDHQSGVLCVPGLKERKVAVMTAAGLDAVDFSPAISIFEQFVNGQISQEEMERSLDAWENE